MFPVTFDWAQIAYIGSPLITPWWAAANVVAGLIIIMWIVAPIIYYKNALYSAFLPILSAAVFDNTGKPYDVSRILTPDFLFDREKYDAYSKVYLPSPMPWPMGYNLLVSRLWSHTPPAGMAPRFGKYLSSPQSIIRTRTEPPTSLSILTVIASTPRIKP